MRKKALLFSTLLLMALALTAVAVVRLPVAKAAPASSQSHVLGIKHATARPKASGNLIYNGGPVMGGTALTYAIFWEPKGSFVSPSYNSLILRYFGDVGGSGLYHNNTQYKDSHGNTPSNSSLGGSWVDTAAYPSKKLSDKQVQNEVTHAMQVNGWSASVDHVFFVFTAKGENICAGSQCSFKVFCAYHSFFGGVIYAAMPYAGTLLNGCGIPSGKSPNGNIDADSEINVTSHEQMESATDPFINAWLDANGQEIGDKCAWNFGTVGSNGANQTWNGHPYIVQQEWDNAKHGCVQSGP